ERIVREEMTAAGFQEVHFPALLPREPYEITGRWTEYGDGVFRVKDRRGADFMLAPTHEEMFTLLVKDLYGSYKDLPLRIFPIQTLVDLLNARPDLARADRPWTAADTLKNVLVKLRHPDRSATVLAIGVPGDREVDTKRLEAQVAPAEIEPFTDEDFAANPLL